MQESTKDMRGNQPHGAAAKVTKVERKGSSVEIHMTEMDTPRPAHDARITQEGKVPTWLSVHP